MGWLVRRVLRNAISSLVTSANVERVLLMVVAMLGKLPIVGHQIQELLTGVDFSAMSEKLAAEILDFLLPLLPQTVGSTAAAFSALGATELETDESVVGDVSKITAALADKVGK